jgi:hypothetical protein
MARLSILISALTAVTLTAGCQTNQAGNSLKSAGQAVAGAAGDAAKGAVSLVNVDLSNVLNDLALDLKVDKSNIPINAQIPVTIAANVCGVSINILSVSSGGSPNCTAKSTSPDLAQTVQQQMAANGSVGGGNQSAPGSTAPAASTATSGTTAPAAPAPSATGASAAPQQNAPQ